MSVQKLAEEVDGVPHGLSVNHRRRRGHDDTQERDHRESKWNTDDLGPDGVTGLMSARRKVGSVGDQSGHVADAAHDGDDHLPSEVRAVQPAGLVDDGSDSLGLDDAPDEEDDTSGGGEDGFRGEEMAANQTQAPVSKKFEGWNSWCKGSNLHLVHFRVKSREGDEPEKEETDEVTSVGSRRLGQAIRNVLDGKPHGPKHGLDAGTADPSLNTVPDASHSRPVLSGASGNAIN